MQLHKVTFIIVLQRPITVLDLLHSSFPACAVSQFRVSSKGWDVRTAKLPNISNKWSDLTWVRATQKQAQLRTPGLAASWIWTAFVWITACLFFLSYRKKMKIGLTLNIYVYISNFSHWSKKKGMQLLALAQVKIKVFNLHWKAYSLGMFSQEIWNSRYKAVHCCTLPAALSA